MQRSAPNITTISRNTGATDWAVHM